jgi:FkbM family methyltransferase
MSIIIDYIKIFHEIFFRSKFFIKRESYGFESEDIYIDEHLKNIHKGFYVDIGAFNPIRGSNTYLLYKRGWSGINVDADENSIRMFKILRRNDYNFNFAVSSSDSKEINLFYEKQSSAVKTVNSEFRDKTLRNFKIKKVKTSNFEDIMNKTNFSNRKIDFLNIDCEGSDYDVLKLIDLKKYEPKLICIEINSHIIKNIEDSNVFKHLLKNNFFLVKSFVNSHIFKLKDN